MTVRGTWASDELRWLRTRWLRRLSERTSIYSVVTTGIVLLYALLGVLELFEDDITVFEAGLSLSILVVCLGIGVAVVGFGVELPRWLGIGLITAHALISVYYLGFSNERQNAIAALQELPIMAMYFSWFYGARIARAGELLILLAVGSATIAGPFSGSNGLLGPANIIGAALFTWLCLEAGLHVRHRIQLESHTDELTGVLNRRGFMVKAQQELRRATRYKRPLSVVLIDLDEFKSINDAAGHAAGDDALRVLSSEWISRSRPADIVGRLGGDEFAMLLPETAGADALVVMARLRENAAHPWSWGVVQTIPGDTVESALVRADAAMYDNKRR